MNRNRTIGIILTIVTVLCCACPGFGLCIFGGLIAAGQPVTTTLNDVESSQVYPASYGIAMICLAVFLVVIPVAVGFFTLRNKPAPAVQAVSGGPNDPLPPAS